MTTDQTFYFCLSFMWRGVRCSSSTERRSARNAVCAWVNQKSRGDGTSFWPIQMMAAANPMMAAKNLHVISGADTYIFYTQMFFWNIYNFTPITIFVLSNWNPLKRKLDKGKKTQNKISRYSNHVPWTKFKSVLIVSLCNLKLKKKKTLKLPAENIWGNLCDFGLE